eukprot:SAG25_NODE_9811_length_357_cov_0.806202_1_plen_77_part_01
MDYSNCGIRCVSVSPGTILTPLVHGVVNSDPVQVGFLLSRCGRSWPANASGFDPHRASISGRVVQLCGAGTCVRVLV